MSKDNAAAAAPSQSADGAPRQTPAKIGLFLAVAVGMTVLDQATKAWIRSSIPVYKGEIPVIDGWLSIIHAENPGAAFGFLNDSPYRMWVFAGFTVVALVVLGRMFLELPEDDRFQNAALGMVVSGAIGNAIDRLRFQSVTDFVKMYTDHASLRPWLVDKFGTAEWPTYNVADIAIVVGLVMFGIHYLFLEKDEEVKPSPPDKALDVDQAPAAAPPAPQPAPAPAPAPELADEEEDEDPPTDPGDPEDLVEGRTEVAAARPDLDHFDERPTEYMSPVEAAEAVKKAIEKQRDES